MVKTKLIFGEFFYELFVLITPEADNTHEGDAQYNVSNVAEHMSIVSYAPIWILAEVVVVTFIQVATGQGVVLVIFTILMKYSRSKMLSSYLILEH